MVSTLSFPQVGVKKKHLKPPPDLGVPSLQFNTYTDTLKLTYCWWFRNPKQPPGMYKRLWILGYLLHQLVQDFFHQQYPVSPQKKRDRFKRKWIIWSNHWFSGEMLVFAGGAGITVMYKKTHLLFKPFWEEDMFSFWRIKKLSEWFVKGVTSHL